MNMFMKEDPAGRLPGAGALAAATRTIAGLPVFLARGQAGLFRTRPAAPLPGDAAPSPVRMRIPEGT